MIQQYINYLRDIRGYSENTAISYEKDLKDFALWAKVSIPGARWSTMTREDIDHYITDLVAAGLKPATTNRRLAAISGLYNFFKRNGHDIENPCKYESRRKRAQTIPNTIPCHDLAKAYEKAYGVTKAMLGILISTGIRIQELLDINWEDINFEDCKIKIHGKGNKERIVHLQPEQLQLLKDVKNNYNVHGTIFKFDQREARRLIFTALENYTDAKQKSPHAIRHTFATKLATNGVNASTLATILGHKDIRTTQQYIDLTQSTTRDAMLNNNILHS